MDTLLSPSEVKLRAIVHHAYMGILEIDEEGYIVNLNISGQALFGPLFKAYALPEDQIFPALTIISPSLVDAITSFTKPAGLITANEVCHFTLPENGILIEKDYKFTISKMFDNCIVMSIEDITSKIAEEQAMQQAQLDKAVAQGKFEIASEVLHDIGNAVVGFGSYLTRINRLLEQSNLPNLTNVAGFMKVQQTAFGQVIGADKAGALVNLMDGIVRTQKDSQEEIKRSITDQLNIITHIQEILNIQRQYVIGHEAHERKPVNLQHVIQDCRAMLFASIDKKGIKLSLNVTPEPVIVKGDRTKLMQVILNILKNSIEAIDLTAAEKSIAVTLAQKAGEVCLTISDNGKGFDAEIAAHLFERRYTTKSSGTGLGLYNCRSIVESHNGSIEIHSAGLGLGAVTTIRFSHQ